MSVRRRIAKPRLPALSEHQLQIQVASHLKVVLPPYVIWFHVPNGEYRTKSTGCKLKAYGVLPGVADLLLFHDSGVLAIELKSATGRQSPEQVAFGDALTALGGMYIVCRSVDQVNAALALAGIHTRERVA